MLQYFPEDVDVVLTVCIKTSCAKGETAAIAVIAKLIIKTARTAVIPNLFNFLVFISFPF